MRFFIGDIHGCAHEFEKLIKKVHKKFDDVELFSVGDVINKGPDSLRCLELVKEHNVTAIRGNHEEILLRLVNNPPKTFSEKEERLIKRLNGEEEKWAKEIQNWNLYEEFEDLDMVHGGLDPRVDSLQFMDPRILTTIRTWDGKGENLNRQGKDKPWFKETKWPKQVVFGHWAQLGLMIKKKWVCLDSGCVYGKTLTGWSPDTDKLIEIKAKKAYSKM
jgi:predicted phosphodiesterase